MNRVLYYFRFDLKLLGSLYFIPLVGYLLTLLLIIWRGFSDPYLTYAFLQGIAVPMASWHLISLYSSLYEDGAKDTLVPIHQKKVLVDIGRYVSLHGFVLLLFVGFISWKNEAEFFDGTIIAHLIILFVFYQLIGLALLTLIESLELTIAIIATYTLTEVVTQGTFMPWPHLFVFLGPVYGMEMNLKFIFLGLGVFLSVLQLWRTFAKR